MRGPAIATWFLKHLGLDDAVLGDLLERYQSGRSARWFYWQALRATFAALRQHALLTILAVICGWLVLWVCFRLLGPPFAPLTSTGLTERYSVEWWLRAGVMWVVVGAPFVASGWLVAKVASRHPLLPVLTFALSVSLAILIALVLDTSQGQSPKLRMWLTVPLFLIVAPATAIVVGGLVVAGSPQSYLFRLRPRDR
jgi:hypothetical protein